mmetsp:Transcript_17947/g.42746  ORF Transcript_17947/g.42746 Transcript_17947/m.42746 type:complete len:401 (-) Transcript_17947:85-1287(-)
MVAEERGEIGVTRCENGVDDDASLVSHRRRDALGEVVGDGVEVDDTGWSELARALQSRECFFSGLARNSTRLKSFESQASIVRSRNAEEGEASSSCLSDGVCGSDEGYQVWYARCDVLYALTQLLQKEVHVSERRQCVIRRQVHLILICQRLCPGELVPRCVACHGALDDRFASTHNSRVEVNLRCEAQGLLEDLQEVLAVEYIGDPVVEITRHQPRGERRFNIDEAVQSRCATRCFDKTQDSSRVRTLKVLRMIRVDFDELCMLCRDHLGGAEQRRVLALVGRVNGSNTPSPSLEGQSGEPWTTNVCVVELLDVTGTKVMVRFRGRLCRVIQRSSDDGSACRISCAKHNGTCPLPLVLRNNAPTHANDELLNEVLANGGIGSGVEFLEVCSRPDRRLIA